MEILILILCIPVVLLCLAAILVAFFGTSGRPPSGGSGRTDDHIYGIYGMDFSTGIAVDMADGSFDGHPF